MYLEPWAATLWILDACFRTAHWRLSVFAAASHRLKLVQVGRRFYVPLSNSPSDIPDDGIYSPRYTVPTLQPMLFSALGISIDGVVITCMYHIIADKTQVES